MTFIFRYRLLEIFQCLWISLSGLLFVKELPEAKYLTIWFSSLFLATGSAFWLNDYFDFKRDQDNPRKVQHTSDRYLRILALISLVSSLLLSLIISTKFFAYIAIIGFASALYSTHWLHLKSRLFFPVYLHFLLGVVFFRSIDALAAFDDRVSSFLMSTFWALILAVGSLANEMVDETADKKSHIDTIAVRYPGLSFYLILGFEILSLLVLGYLSYSQKQLLSVLVILVLGATFVMGVFLRKLSQKPIEFRGFYRIIFITIILVFSLDRFRLLYGAGNE